MSRPRTWTVLHLKKQFVYLEFFGDNKKKCLTLLQNIREPLFYLPFFFISLLPFSFCLLPLRHPQPQTLPVTYCSGPLVPYFSEDSEAEEIDISDVKVRMPVLSSFQNILYMRSPGVSRKGFIEAMPAYLPRMKGVVTVSDLIRLKTNS
jgi:hypothetical protein